MPTKAYDNKYKGRMYSRHARHNKFKYGTSDEQVTKIEAKQMQRYNSHCLKKEKSKAKLYRGAMYSRHIDTFSPTYDEMNDREEFETASNDFAGLVYKNEADNFVFCTS